RRSSASAAASPPMPPPMMAMRGLRGIQAPFRVTDSPLAGQILAHLASRGEARRGGAGNIVPFQLIQRGRGPHKTERGGAGTCPRSPRRPPNPQRPLFDAATGRIILSRSSASSIDPDQNHAGRRRGFHERWWSSIADDGAGRLKRRGNAMITSIKSVLRKCIMTVKSPPPPVF